MFPVPMQTCNAGARIWGVVSDEMHHSLAISLPVGLKGYVSNDEVQRLVSSCYALLCPTHLMNVDPFVLRHICHCKRMPALVASGAWYHEDV